MKKIFPLLLVVVLGFNLVACGDDKHEHGEKISKKEWKENGSYVTGKVRDRVKKKNVMDKKKRDYYIKYSFKVDDKTYNGSQKVKSSIWKQVQKDEPIEVQYIKESPKNNRLTLEGF